MGATLHRGARASHYRGLSCCGAQAPDVQAQQLWLTGLVAPRHVGSSQTRARTRVPCIGRWILNHCATREALQLLLTTNNTAVNSFEHYLCTFVLEFQPGRFLEIELLDQSLKALSIVKCYDIVMTSPSKRDLSEKVPFLNAALPQA